MTNPSGEQWRILGPDETIQEGDEFDSGLSWRKVGESIGSRVDGFIVRRPIPSILEEKKECKHEVKLFIDGSKRCYRCCMPENEIALREQLILADKRTSEAEAKLAEALKPIREITCVYCGFKISLDDKDGPSKMTDHIFSCEKNPLLELAKTACARAESAEKERDEARKIIERIKPATLDRNFYSLSIKRLCADAAQFLSALNEKVKG